MNIFPNCVQLHSNSTISLQLKFNMAFYQSFKQTARNVKRPVLSERAPLSVINGNQHPIRKKVELFESKSIPTTFQENTLSSTLPFSIFADDGPDTCKVAKAENTSAVPLRAANIPSFGHQEIHTVSRDFPWRPADEDFEDACKEEYSPWQPSPTKVDDIDDYTGFDFPYKEQNFAHLRSLEEKYCPLPNYINVQMEIDAKMRTVLIEWLVEVGLQFEFSNETIHLAVALIDRFLSCTTVSKSKFQLVGTACLFIVSKYEDVVTQELKEFSWITDYTYTKKQILRMEQLIMHRVKFHIGGPIALSFAQLAYSIARSPEKVLLLAQYLCELSLLDVEPFLSYLPSHIGVGSYCLARYILGYKMWVNDLSKTGLSFEELKPVINSLHGKMQSLPVSSPGVVTKKYCYPEYLRVGEIEAPVILIMCD